MLVEDSCFLGFVAVGLVSATALAVDLLSDWTPSIRREGLLNLDGIQLPWMAPWPCELSSWSSEVVAILVLM